MGNIQEELNRLKKEYIKQEDNKRIKKQITEYKEKLRSESFIERMFKSLWEYLRK